MIRIPKPLSLKRYGDIMSILARVWLRPIAMVKNRWVFVSIATLICCLISLLCSAPAQAGDEPEHRHMIYALAIAAGLTATEAKVVADGSWSIDQNVSTLAITSIPK